MLPFQFNLQAICLAALTSALLVGPAFADTTLAHARATDTSATSSLGVVERPHQLALVEQGEDLDRRIARLEETLETLKRRAETIEDSVSPMMLTSPLLMARLARVEQEAPIDQEGGVLQLEEIVVEADSVDPFDDGAAEVVEDPWEAFNTKIFAFNLNVDRYVFKPIATGFDWILPDPVEEAIGNAFHNVRFVRRVVNNLLQGKGKGAGIELTRFVINSTLGVAGLFDVAQAGFGLDALDDEDTGQTLAVHGVKPGPYLVLPLLPPTTVRDGVGFIGDLALDPLNYVLPFSSQIATRGTENVNDRSLNQERYQGAEEATLDLYAAVRDAYLQKRAQAIRK
ncbi:VacJ family lipoprotein [Nitrospiraceae bacterium AH_259_D15_M11_P09]|nr:VacJ family lipoprotein [Nitrospiraceae bacterium AH_259_D15_M11_P09]